MLVMGFSMSGSMTRRTTSSNDVLFQSRLKKRFKTRRTEGAAREQSAFARSGKRDLTQNRAKKARGELTCGQRCAILHKDCK